MKTPEPEYKTGMIRQEFIKASNICYIILERFFVMIMQNNINGFCNITQIPVKTLLLKLIPDYCFQRNSRTWIF